MQLTRRKTTNEESKAVNAIVITLAEHGIVPGWPYFGINENPISYDIWQRVEEEILETSGPAK